MESFESNQAKLSELLKKKGIGPEASKSLKAEEIEELKFLLKQSDISLTTKATFLTALLTLEPTEIERVFIGRIKENPSLYLPDELISFITENTQSDFLKIILKVISLKDLTEEEARLGMKFFLSEHEPEFLKGSFLEAERLKRETFLENKVFFESLWNEVERVTIKIDNLIDIADSYDGCNRTRHFSVFVASLIASLGYPVYLHGIEKVAPKEAVTSHQILLKAGKNPLNNQEKVIADLLNPEIGWGYLDQSIFFPKLFALKTMRKEMVKRPFLATFEKLLQPIMSPKGNLIVTGYTHTHYREELINQLKHQGKCQRALVVKGVEGSTQISMSRDTITMCFDGVDIEDSVANPAEFEIQPFGSSRDSTITPEISLQEGIEALEGKEGFAKENIIYTAALILTKFNLEKKETIVEKLRASISSGKALEHWKRGSL